MEKRQWMRSWEKKQNNLLFSFNALFFFFAFPTHSCGAEKYWLAENFWIPKTNIWVRNLRLQEVFLFGRKMLIYFRRSPFEKALKSMSHFVKSFSVYFILHNSRTRRRERCNARIVRKTRELAGNQHREIPGYDLWEINFWHLFSSSVHHRGRCSAIPSEEIQRIGWKSIQFSDVSSSAWILLTESTPHNYHKEFSWLEIFPIPTRELREISNPNNHFYTFNSPIRNQFYYRVTRFVYSFLFVCFCWANCSCNANWLANASWKGEVKKKRRKRKHSVITINFMGFQRRAIRNMPLLPTVKPCCFSFSSSYRRILPAICCCSIEASSHVITHS